MRGKAALWVSLGLAGGFWARLLRRISNPKLKPFPAESGNAPFQNAAQVGLAFGTGVQRKERNLQSLWVSLCSSRGVLSPQTSRGDFREPFLCSIRALLRENPQGGLGLEKLCPSKLGWSQRLSPSAVTPEHLAASWRSPDGFVLLTFLEADSLHLLY